MTDQPTLRHLEGVAPFETRHLGPGALQQAKMLAALGYGSLDELTDAALPTSIRSTEGLDLPAARTETEALADLRALADRNEMVTSMIGLGYHDTITPAVILRNVIESPAWYTAYTPYQPEISQGRLEALLNFQTMIADLTGMALANASLLDEATAAAEAMTLAKRAAKGKSAEAVFLVDADCHPQTIEVVRTRAEPLGLTVVVADLSTGLPADTDAFGLLLPYPGSSGRIVDWAPVIEAAHADGAIVAVDADILALTVLRSPGEMGADVVVGVAQRFGVPLGFGGPHAGYMAVREGLQRSMPGRLVGVSVDADGDRAYRLALQTREQHIRREKATSNICTAQVLLAVTASMYAVYHGPEGLTDIALRTHRFAATLAQGLRSGGVDVVHGDFFDTVTARVPGRAADVVATALDAGVNLRLVDADTVGISTDETTVRADVEVVLGAFGITGADLDALDAAAGSAIPAGLERDTPFLTHPVFHQHRSETAMLRYLRMLADRDLALDRSMIPLGSCTMKLNATAEMEAITWPEFGQIHPFAPLPQSEGYRTLISELEQWLVEITGYAAVSLQPNAGSQGELAGLLAIRGYHHSRGDQQRNLCLIPSSAHGTNAASAVMAGMRVIVVACDDAGNVDLDDLRAKIAENADTLAALMITYPSTHGVFEEAVTDICAAVHDAGGQVYLDGANLNAMVGLARPGPLRRRRQPPEPPQDVLHPPRRWRPRRRPRRRRRAPEAVPAQPPPGGRGRPCHRSRAHLRCPLGIGEHPAHSVGVRPHDGRRRPAPRHPGGHPQRQLHGPPPPAPLPGALHRARRSGRPRVHRGPAAHHQGHRRVRRRRRQAPHRLRLPRPHDVVPGAGDADDRAHRVRGPRRDWTASAMP
jgi:glycine dehydrogenase